MPSQTAPAPVAKGVLNFRIIVDEVEISNSYYSVKASSSFGNSTEFLWRAWSWMTAVPPKWISP